MYSNQGGSEKSSKMSDKSSRSTRGFSNVIPTQRDGNCFFFAILYSKYNTEDRHSRIRLSTVNIIINKWEYCKDFTMDLSTVNSAEDYKNFLSRGEAQIKYTPRQKSIQALEIVLAIFLCFECQFLSFYACYKEYKA